MERIARAQASDAPPDDVAAEVADGLRSVLGWDGVRIFSVDPATLLIGRLLAASERDADQRQRWLREGYRAAERVPFGSFGVEARMRMGVRAITFYEDLDQSYGMPAAIRATYDPKRYVESHYTHVIEYHPGVTIDGNLLKNFPDGQRWVAFMQAYRVSGRRAFRASDVAFAQFAAPRMGKAIGAALRREQRQPVAEPPAGGASGIVVVGRGGDVQYASPAGQAWLDALCRHPLEAQTVLPTAIMAAIAGLRGGRRDRRRPGRSAGHRRVDRGDAGRRQRLGRPGGLRRGDIARTAEAAEAAGSLGSDRGGEPGRGPRHRWTLQPRGRRHVVDQREHRRVAPAADLRQAGRALPQPADGDEPMSLADLAPSL